MKRFLWIFALSSAALLGCQSNVPEPEVKTAAIQPKEPLVQHMVFFAFDKDVPPKGVEKTLMPHVRFLIQNPAKKVLVEGGADETGPEDYNHALGLRRAQQVEKLLLVGGVSKNQIIVRSIGSLRPLNTEKKSHSLERNRRVSLVY